MSLRHEASRAKLLRVGSLFSGYGGLDLAVEHLFGATTIWHSEVAEPVSRVFAGHWPDVPNLGDITKIDWQQVEPIEILCGGFPCQDVSTVGKMLGLAPGTRSGLWANMADAIEQLEPEWVVIENVRGLLSATATRPVPTTATAEGNAHATRGHHATPRNLELPQWGMGDEPDRPLRALGAVLGDLADLGYDAVWCGIPAATVGAPHPRFRIFILAHALVSDSTRIGRIARRREPGTGSSEARDNRPISSSHRSRPERTDWLADMAGRTRSAVEPDRRHLRRWGRYAAAIARWEHITGRVAPSPTLTVDGNGPRPAPEFVEWLMGLPLGWVTDPVHELTSNQQLTALGNGVLPLQAIAALQISRDAHRK